MIALLLAALLFQDPLPTDKEGEAAARKLKEEAAKSSIEGKIAALQEALKTEHEAVIKIVGQMIVTEADPVRIAGATALGAVDHPASAEALAAAILPNLRREEVLPAVLKAIGELGWQAPAGRLNDLLSKVADADTRAVLPEVLSTIGQLGAASSIDPLLDLLLKVENGARRNPWPNEGAIRRNAEEAMRSITGMEFRRVQDWESWWRANQEIIRTKLVRTFWVKKTQDRMDVGPSEKSPSDAILVAARMHSAPVAAEGATAKKKKKKGNK